MPRRLAVAVALATLLAVGLAACGGGSDDEDASGATPVDPADAEFCDAFGAIIVGPLAEEGADVTDPAILEGAVGVTEDALRQLVGGAPPAVADAAASFSAEYEGAFAIWARYGYDLARVEAEATPEEQASLDGLFAEAEGPGATDALDELQTYYFDRCAGDVTLPPDVLDPTTPGTDGSG